MVKDIILDDDADLVITDSGDFLVSDSDQQHIALIVTLAEGALKQFPLQGVGIGQYTGSSGQGATLKRSITTKTIADGYQNVQVALQQNEDGTFSYSITANRP